MEHGSENVDGLKALFGPTTFIGPNSEKVKIEEFAGKTIGIYFSAHWCPPCRGFTPQLVEFYKKFNKDNKRFEIVFVSSDKDEESWKQYFSEMPWLAIPYEDKETKKNLSRKYKVQGIPTLVVVNSNGKTITADGRGEVSDDPEGKRFPWGQKSFWDVMAGEVANNKGEKVNVEELKKAKGLGLYFSAHWCGPCRAFTPKLVESYNKMKSANKGFEIVFCSSDQDKESWQSYFSEMPWLGIPFGDSRKPELSKRYGVRGIPTLVIVDPQTGETITTEGRAALMNDTEGKDFPWHPKPLQQLSNANASAINDDNCFLLLLDKTKAEDQEKLVKVLEPIATEYAQKWKSEETKPLIFFYSCGGDIVGRIRTLLELPDQGCLTILSVPEEQKYISDLTVDKLNGDVLRKYIEDFLHGSLKGAPLQ